MKTRRNTTSSFVSADWSRDTSRSAAQWTVFVPRALQAETSTMRSAGNLPRFARPSIASSVAAEESFLVTNGHMRHEPTSTMEMIASQGGSLDVRRHPEEMHEM